MRGRLDGLKKIEVGLYDKTVSVLMLAYNHESYITEAIESVLNQKCTFSFELVIGEDCSTDRTRSICEWYANKFPDKVKLLVSEKNLGIQGNFLRTLGNCISSEYIAFCEGDDKWSDINKLQYQVDFLRNNLGYLAHSHNVIYKNLTTDEARMFGMEQDITCSADDLFSDWFFHVCSLFIRSDVLREIPTTKLPYFISCDLFLNRWLACHGEVYYEGTKSMATYQRHLTGASENSDYIELRYQNLDMLVFFENSFGSAKTLIKQPKHIAIENLYYQLACTQNQKLIGRNRFKDIFYYSTSISFKRMRKRDLYMFLIILFGRPFFILHGLFKKVGQTKH